MTNMNNSIQTVVNSKQALTKNISKHSASIVRLTSNPITPAALTKLLTIQAELTEILPANEWVAQNALKHLNNIITAAHNHQPIDEADIAEVQFALGMTRKAIWARVKHEHGNIDAYFNNHRTKRVKKPTKPKLRVVSNNDDYDDEETKLTTGQRLIGLLVLLSLLGLLVWGVWSIGEWVLQLLE